ncbi:MAG: hypothetical protein Q7R35_04960 [Elusimicrobiota bacterium]|nr:hypothetical protein [Elusimicrobiota bacterium]
MTARQQASVYRQQVPALVKHIGWLASMAQGSSELLPGSIYGRRRRCGKPGCRCTRGHLHNDTVLAVHENGRRRLVSLSAIDAAGYGLLIRNWRQFQRNRRELKRTFKKLLLVYDKLGKIRRMKKREQCLDR